MIDLLHACNLNTVFPSRIKILSLGKYNHNVVFPLDESNTYFVKPLPMKADYFYYLYL